LSVALYELTKSDQIRAKEEGGRGRRRSGEHGSEAKEQREGLPREEARGSRAARAASLRLRASGSKGEREGGSSQGSKESEGSGEGSGNSGRGSEGDATPKVCSRERGDHAKSKEGSGKEEGAKHGRRSERAARRSLASEAILPEQRGGGRPPPLD